MDWERVNKVLPGMDYNIIDGGEISAEVKSVVLQDIQRWVNILAFFGGVPPFTVDKEFEVGYIDLVEDNTNQGVIDTGIQIVFQGEKTTQVFDMMPAAGFPQSHYATASTLITMYKQERG